MRVYRWVLRVQPLMQIYDCYLKILATFYNKTGDAVMYKYLHSVVNNIGPTKRNIRLKVIYTIKTVLTMIVVNGYFYYFNDLFTLWHLTK